MNVDIETQKRKEFLDLNDNQLIVYHLNHQEKVFLGDKDKKNVGSAETQNLTQLFQMFHIQYLNLRVTKNYSPTKSVTYVIVNFQNYLKATWLTI
jgi:hypothetical protein